MVRPWQSLTARPRARRVKAGRVRRAPTWRARVGVSPVLDRSSIQKGTVSKIDRRPVRVRRPSLSQEHRSTGSGECPQLPLGGRADVQARLGNALRSDFLCCHPAIGVRELDFAARLALPLRGRRGRSVLFAAFVTRRRGLGLRHAVAVADDDPAHRLADVQQHSRNTGGGERNRQQDREETQAHGCRQYSIDPPVAVGPRDEGSPPHPERVGYPTENP